MDDAVLSLVEAFPKIPQLNEAVLEADDTNSTAFVYVDLTIPSEPI